MLNIKILQKIILTCLILTSNSLLSQENFSIETFPSRYRLSYETVKMPYESDMGFMGIGFDLFQLVNKSSNVYFGINSYSAVTGIRPGLITLGISGGYRRPLFKNTYLDVGGFIGGGGGGGAADGGGLIVRPHVNLEHQIGNFGFQVGLSHIQFPTGEIKSTQINAGITINTFNYLATDTKPSDYISEDQIKTTKLRVALVGTQYFNFSKGTSVERLYLNTGRVNLIGGQLERYFSPHFYGILKLNAAITGGADGYMNILLGAGGKLPILKNYFNLESRFLFGPSGGGSILSGGGATAQLEAGFSVPLFKAYDLKVMYGRTLAPWGTYASNHLEVGIGRSFESLFIEKKSDTPETFTISSKDFFKNKMAFMTYNRTYFPPAGQTKNPGRYYQLYFNLLGFEFQKYIGNRFSLNGGTVWAYQGDYGAYAEGLLGCTYYQPITPTWNINIKYMFGAGGGGAINLGSGLITQFFIGTEKKMNDKWSLCGHFGKLIPIHGNFKPIIADIGIKFNINQLLKK